MKPVFLIPSVDFVKYRATDSDSLKNYPVNIVHCKNIKKGSYTRYPDSEGLYTIIFDGCDVTWYYRSRENRDRDYFKIINNSYGGLL